MRVTRSRSPARLVTLTRPSPLRFGASSRCSSGAKLTPKRDGAVGYASTAHGDDGLDTIAEWIAQRGRDRDPHRRGDLDRVGDPGLPRAAGRLDEEPGGREDRERSQYYVTDPEIRKLAWQNRLRSEIWQAQPNAGHRAIAELEQKANVHTLVTQNIDGLHLAAGSSPEKMIEIHGTVHAAKCLQCGWRGPDGRDAGAGRGRRGGPGLPRVRRDAEVAPRSASARTSCPRTWSGPTGPRSRARPVPRARHVARRLPGRRPARGRAVATAPGS